MTEPVTLEQQVAEVARECATRERVYGQWVLQGRMTPEESATRLRRMGAVRATLEALAAGRPPPTRPAASLDEQVAEVTREQRLRANVYPRWVDARRMSDAEAERRIGHMAAALATLEELAAARRATQPELGL